MSDESILSAVEKAKQLCKNNLDVETVAQFGEYLEEFVH